jgi:hypothetical protein
MTRDELIGKVAESFGDAAVCPGDCGLPDWYATCFARYSEADDECKRCWATAIVNLVKGEEEKG